MISDATDRRSYGPPAAGEDAGLAVSIGLCVLLAGCLAFFGFNRTDKTKHVLQSRINPNTASKDSFMQLPGIGPKTAQNILKYRQSASGQLADGAVFRSAEDLQNVKGIGPKTVENIRCWLLFE